MREVVSTLIAEKDGRMIRGRGRPSIITNEEQLQYLVEQGFGAKEIGDMFNCSKRTVERKVKQCGLSLRNYSSLNDDELDAKGSVDIWANAISIIMKDAPSRLRRLGASFMIID